MSAGRLTALGAARHFIHGPPGPARNGPPATGRGPKSRPLPEGGAPWCFPEAPAGFRWQRFPLRRPEASAPLEVLCCPDFPALHGFACRARNRKPEAPRLGVRERKAADLELLERAAGLSVLHVLRQVHGNEVQVAAGTERAPSPLVGDALVARSPGAGVVIQSADCLPVLLADPVSGLVAGIHAGWRGTLARVAGKAAGALAREAGAPPSRLRAVVGPAIRRCCFEVGPEVVSAFREDGQEVRRIAHRPEGMPDAPRGRPHLDLPLANRLQLLEAGLREEAIHDAALCTRCQPAFHSYRREGPGVGRNWSLIAAGL